MSSDIAASSGAIAAAGDAAAAAAAAAAGVAAAATGVDAAAAGAGVDAAAAPDNRAPSRAASRFPLAGSVAFSLRGQVEPGVETNKKAGYYDTSYIARDKHTPLRRISKLFFSATTRLPR